MWIDTLTIIIFKMILTPPYSAVSITRHLHYPDNINIDEEKDPKRILKAIFRRLHTHLGKHPIPLMRSQGGYDKADFDKEHRKAHDTVFDKRLCHLLNYVKNNPRFNQEHLLTLDLDAAVYLYFEVQHLAAPICKREDLLRWHLLTWVGPNGVGAML